MADRFKLLLRATAVLLLAGGIALFVATVRGQRDADGAARGDVAPPAMLLLVCVGSAVGLWAVSLVPVAQRSEAERAEATRLTADVTAALVRLDDVVGALDRLAREVRAAKNGPVRPIVAAEVPQAAPSLDPGLIERFERSLQEVRELAMLTEAERQRRFDVTRSARRVEGVQALLRLIDEHKFAAADRLFGELCREYSGDLDVAGAGKQLSAARQRFQGDAVSTEAAMIEIDLSAGAWEDALRRSQDLVAEFPGSDAAVGLLARVRRDHVAWRETLAQSLFDHLRQQIDQRAWRVALATAQQLLKEFPTHNLAEQVSRQISLIQNNAEIEQRQEQEIYIRELIKSRQFNEAIEQAEDLLRRFPLSPQAEAIDVLLPRIRELAIQEETSAASLSDMPEFVTILGDGAMATVCSILLSAGGHGARIWGALEKGVADLARDRGSEDLLPGVRLPDSVQVTASDGECFAGCTIVVSAIPTQYLRAVWERLVARLPGDVPIVSVTKGIDAEGLLRPSEVIRQVLGERKNPIAVLSGPNIATELARRLPASAVVAGADELARNVQRVFSTQWLRVYTNRDVIGVELAGATKNVIAIAAGILDGMKAGDNAKAALVTRGLVEIARLGVAMGADERTFWGLAGIGDLVTTCVSPVGRNRTVGQRLGEGEKLAEILASMHSVAEGVPTTRAVKKLATKLGIEMPITAAVHAVLFEGKPVREALGELMSREMKAEVKS